MGFFRDIFSALFSGNSTPVTRLEPVCPACSRALSRSDIEGNVLHACMECGGMWITPQAFSEMLESADELLSATTRPSCSYEKTFMRSDSSRLCPSCDAQMDNYQYQYTSGIWIDACPNGHGIWLDAGEMILIKSHHRKMAEGPTLEEKEKLSMAFLDGAAKTMGNLAQSMAQINQENRARHADFRHRHYGW